MYTHIKLKTHRNITIIYYYIVYRLKKTKLMIVIRLFPKTFFWIDLDVLLVILQLWISVRSKGQRSRSWPHRIWSHLQRSVEFYLVLWVSDSTGIADHFRHTHEDTPKARFTPTDAMRCDVVGHRTTVARRTTRHSMIGRATTPSVHVLFPLVPSCRIGRRGGCRSVGGWW